MNTEAESGNGGVAGVPSRYLLDAKHPYYASTTNYYTTDFPNEWETLTDFLNEFEDADLDMNQVFRWDIRPESEEWGHSVLVVLIHQRKGLYSPNIVHARPTSAELVRFESYLDRHWENLRLLWTPFSSNADGQRIRERSSKDSLR